MRWTDLPGDRGSADDADPPVLRRGDWDDLRQRLQRLPAGHPSAPDGEDGAEPGGADEVGRSPGPAEVQDQEAGRRNDGRAEDRHAGPGGPRGHDAGRAAVFGPRETYRPWFTAGESPEPWFYADPGA